MRLESRPYLVMTYAAELNGSEKRLIFTVLAGQAALCEDEEDDGPRAPLVASSRGALRFEDAGL